MASDVQVVVDCARPHELAQWWAQTLDWLVEEQDENFIRRMIAEGYATEGETMTWEGRLVWRTGAAILHPDLAVPRPRRRILFQQVPEPKTSKNRWHVDIRVGADSVSAVRDTLTARGATFLYSGQQGPHGWVTMADPEGNEFCLS